MLCACGGIIVSNMVDNFFFTSFVMFVLCQVFWFGQLASVKNSVPFYEASVVLLNVEVYCTVTKEQSRL